MTADLILPEGLERAAEAIDATSVVLAHIAAMDRPTPENADTASFHARVMALETALDVLAADIKRLRNHGTRHRRRHRGRSANSLN